jgi:hypothetical protein
LAQNTALQKPSRVEQARGRLDAAVAKLEAALASRPAPVPSGEIDGALAEAGAQIAELQNQLETMHAKNADLKRVNEQVAGRIDGVIAGLKSSLGE